MTQSIREEQKNERKDREVEILLIKFKNERKKKKWGLPGKSALEFFITWN